ncbi:MAG TPA: MATE family efflux transporter [Myxococcota bacterium]|jgi:MATE family multidrug resistance protein
METREPLSGEVARLARLAVPVALSNLGMIAMGAVDQLLLGHYGTTELAAVGLANPWIFGTIMFANGILLGLDPIIARAHGAGDGARSARALHSGLVLALALALPVAILWWFTEPVLIAIGQEPALSKLAATFVRAQIPSIPFFLGNTVLSRYLQNREHVKQTVVVMAIANLVNALAAWSLIYGHLGLPSLGVLGAGLATNATRIASTLTLVAWTRAFRLYEGAWEPFDAGAFEWRKHAEILRYGVPIAFQTCTEMWAFGLASFIAGPLGEASLAAHQVTMQFASITFMIPLGISQAVTIRAGNLLGARRPAAAARAGWLGIAGSAAFMALAAATFILGRNWLPQAFTNDATVIAAAATILPIAGAFEIFDGTQAAACGMLRGMGRPLPATVMNLIGYWVIALPLGAFLALRTSLGLRGLWVGLLLGLIVVAVGLVLWLRKNQPRAGSEASA